MSSNETLYERFWKYVKKPSNDEDCFEWIGTISSNGYGQVRYNYQRYLAHRLSYELFISPITDATLYVCHRCDNRKCVNPKHLFLGTAKDNYQDSKNKGRNLHGSKHPRARLTEQQVIDIRNSKLHFTELAALYNVSHGTIQHILTRISWKHI